MEKKEHAMVNTHPDTDRPDLDSRQKTVLVVDDDRSHSALVDKILRTCGFDIVHAAHGLDALSVLDGGGHFDLILMDLDMPHLNGIETTKAIRTRETQSASVHRTIIAFTSHRTDEDRAECLAAGMDAYLPKDILLPRWRGTLIDNLQGMVAGTFDIDDFEHTHTLDHDGGRAAQGDLSHDADDFDLKEFDRETFEHTRTLLKDELPIAVEEYLEDAAAYIRDIKTGLTERDLVKMGRGSHPLKSNSKSFGLMAVSKISERINMIAEQGSQNDEMYARLAPLCDLLSQAFEIGEKRIARAVKGDDF